MLVSRDEQSVLVVSYKEIKACVASAFAYVISQYILVFFSKWLCSLGSCRRDERFRLSRALQVSMRRMR